MPANTATMSIEDYDAEKSRFSVNVGPLTAANYTAKHAAIDALKDALPGIIMGEVRSVNINEIFTESVAPVTAQQAQRETKWLVTLRDVTEFFDVGNTISNPGYGNLFQIEVPTADLSLLANNSDELPLTGITAVEDFVTALEAVANSPTGGPDVQVISIRHVGRNL